MAVLALKLILAPAFVVGASLTARRFGPRIGGLVGGLPVVAGPILLVLAIIHDRAFATRSATTSLLGLVSLSAFVLVYGFAAQRLRWPATLALAWLAFLAMTAFASAFHIAATPALVVAFASFALARAVLPIPAAGSAPTAVAPGPCRAMGHMDPLFDTVPGPRRVVAPPSWDLPVRAACAAAMVLAITAASAGLGPRLSGLLAPSPIITTVLAAFTHAQLGSDATLRLLRGMLTGFFAFALFCWTVALTLPHTSIALAFALATAVALLTQAAILGGEVVGSRP
ncbi:hypothetical protein [Baekduia sp.]|uniref:hypothetical protein n=1 Tax=Baekduia sp. TaxID=2600305 RepID=UPI002DFBD0E4|nr:hypothetical protein [Baekduia sp.]